MNILTCDSGFNILAGTLGAKLSMLLDGSKKLGKSDGT